MRPSARQGAGDLHADRHAGEPPGRPGARGGSSRVIVQEESHLYQDEGDCAQTLSNLTLMPLAADARRSRPRTPARAGSDQERSRGLARLSDLDRDARPAQAGRAVRSRRAQKHHRHRPPRRHPPPPRWRTDLLESAYSGESVADYSAPFDTVYVSLYKYFNAASGGDAGRTARSHHGMFHTRRMFGGGLNHAWPFALVALHYLDGFGDRFGRAVRVSEDWIRALRQDDRFTIDRVALGTNLFRLQVRGPIRRRSENGWRHTACSSPRRSAARS